MSSGNRKVRFAFFAAMLCAGFLVTANGARAGDASMSPGTSSAPDMSTALYTPGGSATCLTCHNSAPVNDIMHTPMAVTGDPRTPFGQHGCESCHGPSDAHVEGWKKGVFVEPAIVFSGPHASPIAVQNQVCLSCHEDAQHINWTGSPHQRNDLTCATCHTVHADKDPVLARETQVAVCFRCHTQQRAESFEYSHHPMQEGRVICSDCHNPHGSAGPYQLKEFTVNETCYNCHADKRGPMLWEHQPVRENCLNCHTPHGSNQPRLLKEPLNFLCASCHSAVSNRSGGAFGGAHALPGDLQGAAMFNSALANNRLCLNCHSQVHGSNSPNGAYFLR
jgi:DmsE family decaheme c-type cytochrome